MTGESIKSGLTAGFAASAVLGILMIPFGTSLPLRINTQAYSSQRIWAGSDTSLLASQYEAVAQLLSY